MKEVCSPPMPMYPNITTNGHIEPDKDQIQAFLKAIKRPGEALPLRVIGRDDVFYETLDDAATAAQLASTAHRPVYVVLHGVGTMPETGSTKDDNISRYLYMPVDFDPVRQCVDTRTVPATDAEKSTAYQTMQDCRDYLRDMGFNDPIVGDSGNGYHLLYPINLPNNSYSKALIKNALEALNNMFGCDRVTVDESVHNPSRVWKVYGTVAYKGEATTERPHRVSRVLSMPDAPAINSRSLLEALADKAPAQATPPAATPAQDYDGPVFDVQALLDRAGVVVKRVRPQDGGDIKWELNECPWRGHDDHAVFIIQKADGRIRGGCSHNSCKGLGWSYPAGESMRAIYEALSHDSGDSSDGYDSFSEENDKFIDVPAFPVDALPEVSAQFVREAAAALNCPSELVAVPVLAALSGACGYARSVRVKQGWEESAALYAAVVADPGSKKSPASSMAYRPLERLQGKLRGDYKESRKHYEAELRQHTLDKKLASKEDKPEPEPPKPPFMKRCIVDDITVEALAGLLEQNPKGFLSAQDELTGFLKGMDQYKSGGKGNARQSYLKMWSNSPIHVDRKGGDEPVIVSHPFLTLQGSIQPGVLGDIADGRDDGFLDRFIFGYPEPARSGYSEAVLSYETAGSYEGLIKGLWQLNPRTDDYGEVSPIPLTLSPDAKSLFKDQSEELSTEAYTPGFPSRLKGPWAKMESHLVRLALILAVSRIVTTASEEAQITYVDMSNAVRLLHYFKATTRKVYGQLFEANPGEVLADALVTLLTHNEYVYSGTISNLMEQLPESARPESPETLGRQIRRLVKANPDLSMTTGRTGTERKITLTLRKTVTTVTTVTSPAAQDKE